MQVLSFHVSGGILIIPLPLQKTQRGEMINARVSLCCLRRLVFNFNFKDRQ